MKCSKCFIKECDRKYSNRHHCVGEKEGIRCTCICQITSKDASLASAASVGTGAAVIVAGMGLTALTGGAFAIIAGASVICAGASLVISPLKKRLIGERLTHKELKEELIFGAAVGALASPIGLVGTIATKSVSDVIRLKIKNRKMKENLYRSEGIEGISFREINDEFDVEIKSEKSDEEKSVDEKL